MYNYIRKVVKEYLVAIYIRLSKEDDNLGESESVGNQKLLLTKYVKEQGYTLVDIYIDDGYTGTNFNRPNFQRMLKDIEIGKVNMVITKDLSRLSRDYIGTGEYVEKWFPAHNVRYVALTDNVDTFLDNSNNDIAPFKAILNDMYAKDLSKKIRTALHTMQCEGKWVGGCPPFGYKVDPNDKNHLVIDEVEAPIVKRIFNMFASGIRINKIRDTFNNENVPTFSTTRNRNFTRNGSNGNIYGYWCNTTIKKILQNRLYTGDMIQNKRFRLSYKYRKIVCNPQENWIIVENTHEPIIDKNILLLRYNFDIYLDLNPITFKVARSLLDSVNESRAKLYNTTIVNNTANIINILIISSIVFTISCQLFCKSYTELTLFIPERLLSIFLS